MSVRPLRPRDESAVRSLQGLLAYADPTLVTAALDGLFVGRVAVEAAGESERHHDDVRQGGTTERVVGYAVAMPGDWTTLTELAVAADSRRDGHGRALVAAVVAATGATELVVTTPVGNDRALAFYRSLGFDRDVRLESFYADGSAALRFRRRE